MIASHFYVAANKNAPLSHDNGKLIIFFHFRVKFLYSIFETYSKSKAQKAVL